MLCSVNAWAQKLSFGFGAYDVSAQVEDQETSVTNLGAYKIQYNFVLQEKIDLFLSYNLIVEDIFNGDKAFGPQFGLAYYPRGSKSVSNSSLGNISFLKMKDLNYYFTASFVQRQYQSIKTNYAGFSIGAGVEWGINDKLILYSDFQTSLLEGANGGEATETMATFGVRFFYDD